MVNKKFLSSLSVIFSSLKNNIKEIYQCSNFYEKKISKVFDSNFKYKPSPHLFSSIVKYQKKKYLIEDFTLDFTWKNNINSEDYEKLNNFFGFLV